MVPLVVFVVCLFLLYSTMTVVIQMTSATIVNLSILSADFYTLLFGLFLFNYKVGIELNFKQISRSEGILNILFVLRFFGLANPLG